LSDKESPASKKWSIKGYFKLGNKELLRKCKAEFLVLPAPFGLSDLITEIFSTGDKSLKSHTFNELAESIDIIQ
jgi:hypothetical protein